MKTETRDFSVGALAIFVAGVLAVLFLIIWGTMAIFGWGFVSQHTADLRGETSKKNQVEGSGAYRIAAYDHFFDLCTSIQTKEDTIDAQKGELKTHPDAERRQQINANIAALKGARNGDIREYNNDARKAYTSGQFRSSDLPYHLDPAQEHTSCTY